MPNRIILCGPYACGKTTVGKRLAEKMGWAFVDTDEKYGQPVRRAHQRLGESAFRELEEQVLKGVIRQENVVIATGGGCVVHSKSRELLMAARLVVRLDVSEEGLWQRWQTRGPPHFAKTYVDFQAYLKFRDPLYQEVADATVSATDFEHALRALGGLCG